MTLCVVIVIVINDLLVHSFWDQGLQVIVNQNGLNILKFHFSLHAASNKKDNKGIMVSILKLKFYLLFYKT